MNDKEFSLDFYPYRGEKIPADFVCKEENKPLVDFLNKNAKKCQKQLVSKVFVIRDKDKKFIGYVAFGIKLMLRKDLKISKSRGQFERPALVIGQLLIDENYRFRGYGKIVLKFVISIVLLLKAYIPLRLLVVEALHENSKRYFEDQWKFEPLPEDPYTLVFDLWQILRR